jgi:hypothetical protein
VVTFLQLCLSPRAFFIFFTVHGIHCFHFLHLSVIIWASSTNYHSYFRLDGSKYSPQRFAPKHPLKDRAQLSESTNELYRLSDRLFSAKLVQNFADRGCHVVSVTDPYGRILGFLDRNHYFFLPSSSSSVLTRLTGPRSRPSTSQKMR